MPNCSPRSIIRNSDSVPRASTRTALSRPRRTNPTVVSGTFASWTTSPAGWWVTWACRATSPSASSDTPRKYSWNFNSGRMSSLMAAPFEFAADVVPEPVLGGAVGDLVETRRPPEFREGQGPVQSAVLVEGLVEPGVGEHPPVAAEPPAGQPVERRGAVRAQPVVPAGRLGQAVDRPDVIEEHGPQFVGTRVEPVQERLLAPGGLRAAQDDVPLVG